MIGYLPVLVEALETRLPISKFPASARALESKSRTELYVRTPSAPPMRLSSKPNMTSEATAQVLAFITAIFYASALVSARVGLRYSTPTTVTLGRFSCRIFFVDRRIRDRRRSRRSAVRHSAFHAGRHFSARCSSVRLHRRRKDRRFAQQRAAVRKPAIQRRYCGGDPRRGDFAADLLGTLLIVGGIVLVSWKPEEQLRDFRRWHLLLPIAAALLTGMNHPIRRYVLTMANEPLFFSALMGAVSLGGFLIYFAVSPRHSVSSGTAGRSAISRHGIVRNLFHPVHHYGDQFGPRRHRRSHRRQLSGMVAIEAVFFCAAWN